MLWWHDITLFYIISKNIFNNIIQSSTIKRNRYIEKKRITVSDSDTQKTSTEKLFDLRIYHTYYIDFFKSERRFQKNLCILILECSK